MPVSLSRGVSDVASLTSRVARVSLAAPRPAAVLVQGAFRGFSFLAASFFFGGAGVSGVGVFVLFLCGARAAAAARRALPSTLPAHPY